MTHHALLILGAAGLLLAGCTGEPEPAPAPPPAPPAAMAPVVVDVASSVATPGPASSPAATPPPEVPAAAVQLTEESPLGGKGRALTEQEIGLLNYGIYMFKEEKGRYPSSLQEAVTARYIARLPELPSGQSYQYDATSGQVKIEGAK